MRNALDAIYKISGGLAAASIVAIVLIVFGQVMLNIIDYLAKMMLGKSIGLLIPSYTSLSGYGLAFATFLSLGLGLRKAVHIRVTLVESRLPRSARRFTLIMISLIAVMVGILFTYSLALLAFQSYSWGDRGTGLLKVPLWIPQSILCIGMTVFLIAALDTLIEVLRHGHSNALDAQSNAEEGI
ncbi:TRAP transporter small permease [Alcaligenaceae bacterium CGII-47]|nr:TRAP transporter small permease [Alcaligenaceae bacterium CGII-47]